MRIAYLTHQYLPRHVGGTETYTRGLALRARKAGHLVAVITYVESPSGSEGDFGVRRESDLELPVFEVHYNLNAAPEPARYEFDNAFTGAAVGSLLDALRPDVAHVMHPMKLTGSALAACHSRGIPVVLTLCDFWLVCPRHTLLTWNGRLCRGPRAPTQCARCLQHTHRFFSSSWMRALPEGALRLALRAGLAAGLDRRPWRDARAVAERPEVLRDLALGARRIIALSEFQKGIFVENGYPPQRIEVIPHGLEAPPAVGPAATPPRRATVVFIGSPVPHKGLHVLLEALRREPDLALDFVVYGALREEDSYCHRIGRLIDADPRVEHRGTFAPEEIGAVLAQATAVAIPSLWYENDPLVAKACLHFGIPVLASRIGSLQEMGADSEGWTLLPAGDAGAWAEALRRVANRAHRPPGTGRPVKSIDENAREMLRIYAEEAGGSR